MQTLFYIAVRSLQANRRERTSNGEITWPTCSDSKENKRSHSCDKRSQHQMLDVMKLIRACYYVSRGTRYVVLILFENLSHFTKRLTHKCENVFVAPVADSVSIISPPELYINGNQQKRMRRSSDCYSDSRRYNIYTWILKSENTANGPLFTAQRIGQTLINNIKYAKPNALWNVMRRPVFFQLSLNYRKSNKSFSYVVCTTFFQRFASNYMLMRRIHTFAQSPFVRPSVFNIDGE